MTSYQFQSSLYRTRRERNAAVAYEWMTAGGLNKPATVDDLLSRDADPASHARECAESWNMLEPALDYADEPQEPDYTLDELIEAFADFIAARPDRRDD